MQTNASLSKEKRVRKVKIRSCIRKIYHPTKERAEIKLAKMRKDPKVYDADKLHVYDCKFCNGWHIGHEHPKHKDPVCTT